MHEFSIGDSIVRSVIEELARLKTPPGALRSVRVAIGVMRQIVPDTLVFAYESLSQDTPAAGSKLVLRAVPVMARCTACGWQGALEVPLFLCGACQSGEIELMTGMELQLESLEVEDDGHAEH
ncbi:MAG: hydrogenase maturation nickel metallochaperone HypA [Verrucomicrobia bacterium]|nr:hydrogenase maturation nickel metallochaperone HypA [Verrucomicrobiota bacterium]